MRTGNVDLGTGLTTAAERRRGIEHLERRVLPVHYRAHSVGGKAGGKGREGELIICILRVPICLSCKLTHEWFDRGLVCACWTACQLVCVYMDNVYFGSKFTVVLLCGWEILPQQRDSVYVCKGCHSFNSFDVKDATRNENMIMCDYTSALAGGTHPASCGP